MGEQEEGVDGSGKAKAGRKANDSPAGGEKVA
jgi:hypothetical protein